MPGPRHISHTHQRALESAAFQERRAAAAAAAAATEQERINIAAAEEARARLAELPKNADQEIRFLESMMTGATRFQPGIVLEKPQMSNEDKRRLFSLEEDYKKLLKFASGEELVDSFSFNIRLNIIGHGYQINVSGNPLLNPKITSAVKDNYTLGTDNPYDIPMYLIIRGMNGGHLSLLIWIKGVIYSLGCAFSMPKDETYRNLYEYFGSLAKQFSLVQLILDRQKKEMESATPAPLEGGDKGAAAAALPVVAAAAVALPVASKGVKAALHEQAEKAVACFYSPDTVIQPHQKTSKGKFFEHKLYDMGFLKTHHIKRINQFIEKGKMDKLAEKDIDGSTIWINRDMKYKNIQYSNVIMETGKIDVENLSLTFENDNSNFGTGNIYSKLGKIFGFDKTIFPNNNKKYFIYSIGNKKVYDTEKTLEEIKAIIANHDTGLVKTENLQYFERANNPLTITFLLDPTEVTGNPSVPAQPWNFDMLNINLAASYTHLSNEYDVARTIDNFNCTSFLASVFRERISCMGRWRFSKSLEEVGSYVALMSNPRSCATRTYYGLDYPDPGSFFRAFANFVLDVKAHRKQFSDISPDMFNVLNDSLVRPSVSPLHIRNRLNRAGLHGLAKLGNSVVGAVKAVEGGKRSTKNRRRRSNKTRKQRR
jgi:hypothetical protein